jgi:uncharacterized protein (DUF169 family)
MNEFEVLHQAANELERRIRLQTFPIGIKFLEKESDIPDGAQRSLRDMNHYSKSCQDFAMSRRVGMTVASTFEDMYCPEAAIGFGLAHPPDFYFEGRHRFPQSVENTEAGSAWAHQFPKMKEGKYIGVVSSPLNTIHFKPDVIIMYVDAAQLRTLLIAAASKEGPELTCTIIAKGACVYSTVPPVQTGKFQVTLPCPGDSRFAAAQHDEMIFSVPMVKLQQLLNSLRYLEQWGYKLPFRFMMNHESSHPGNYTKMAHMMGMNWIKGDEMKEKYGKKVET